MQSLRDQLIKTGMATKQKKHQIEQEKRRERKQHKKGRAEDTALAQQQQAHEARLEAQRAADRQRAAEQRADLDAKETRLRLLHIIDYWQVLEEPLANRRWYFTTRDNTIKCLYVSEPLAARLNAGDIAIVERPDIDEPRYVLVDQEAAQHIAPIDHLAVRFSTRTGLQK